MKHDWFFEAYKKAKQISQAVSVAEETAMALSESTNIDDFDILAYETRATRDNDEMRQYFAELIAGKLQMICLGRCGQNTDMCCRHCSLIRGCAYEKYLDRRHTSMPTDPYLFEG